MPEPEPQTHASRLTGADEHRRQTDLAAELWHNASRPTPEQQAAIREQQQQADVVWAKRRRKMTDYYTRTDAVPRPLSEAEIGSLIGQREGLRVALEDVAAAIEFDDATAGVSLRLRAAAAKARTVLANLAGMRSSEAGVDSAAGSGLVGPSPESAARGEQ